VTAVRRKNGLALREKKDQKQVEERRISEMDRDIHGMIPFHRRSVE
jgi:hypothetical protein